MDKVTEPIHRMTVAEFRAAGYLREVNRQFLHPLGMALEVVVDDDGNERFGEVWDYRDEPGGLRFEDDPLGITGLKASGPFTTVQALALACLGFTAGVLLTWRAVKAPLMQRREAA